MLSTDIHPARATRPRAGGVHLFLDLSNIFISARHVAGRREGRFAESEVRLHYDNLLRLAHGGRQVVSGVCVTSYICPAGVEPMWLHRLRQLPIEVVAV